VSPVGRVEPPASAQEHLDQVQALLEGFRAGDRAPLQAMLDRLHPADVAYVLEGLPLQDRLLVWGLVRSDRDGEILLEVSDAVRDTLLADMDSAEIVAAAQNLDADEIADLAPDLPDEVVQDIIEAQDVEDRAQLQSALSYEEGTVGALMDFEVVSIRDDVTCETALRYLRRFDELPGQTDALFVVDREDHLKGVLPLKKLLVSDPDVEVAALYERAAVALAADTDAEEAAQAFERYDLVSAPVVDAQGRVIARLTVDAVLDYVRESHEEQELGKVGLREEEDIFSSVWASAKNRGPWLALNLCTAFIASRVIGAFEGSIAKLAALAALMPIVAGIGGNAGTQTLAVTVRALATNQLTASNTWRAVRREISIAALNGISIAVVISVVVTLIFGNWHLGMVIGLAMMANILIAGIAGVLVPLTIDRFRADPAIASSIFVTMTTDSMGFLVFLGLATVSGLVG